MAQARYKDLVWMVLSVERSRVGIDSSPVVSRFAFYVALAAVSAGKKG